MRTTERPAELAAESFAEASVEYVTAEFEEFRSRVATAFATRGFGRFDRNEGLFDRDLFDAQRFWIEVQLDAHHVNHTGRLDVVDHRNEAMLAEVDDIAARMPERVRLAGDDDRERAGVEWATSDGGHIGSSSPVVRNAGRSCAADGR